MEILEYEKLLEQLQRLTEEETLGREYYMLYNHNMDYAQYIYLINNPNQKNIKDLMQPKSVLIQNQIRKQYKKYHMGGLTEKDFFPPDENIVVNDYFITLTSLPISTSFANALLYLPEAVFIMSTASILSSIQETLSISPQM